MLNRPPTHEINDSPKSRRAAGSSSEPSLGSTATAASLKTSNRSSHGATQNHQIVRINFESDSEVTVSNIVAVQAPQHEPDFVFGRRHPGWPMEILRCPLAEAIEWPPCPAKRLTVKGATKISEIAPKFASCFRASPPTARLAKRPLSVVARPQRLAGSCASLFLFLCPPASRRMSTTTRRGQSTAKMLQFGLEEGRGRL